MTAGQSENPRLPAGARIDEIAPLPSDPNVRRIKVAGTVIARLPARVVESLGLEVGRRWNGSLARNVAEAIEVEKARKAALTMLGRRALSLGEVIERLVRRGHALTVASRVAKGLEADHWIDDKAYAMALAEELCARKSASHAMIVDRLVRRRIPEDIAIDAARSVLAEVDSLEAATDFARKRLAQMKGDDRHRAARRIGNALARRGFDEETVIEALRRLELA